MKNDTIMTRLISGLVMAVLLGLPVQDGFAQSHRDSSNSAMGRIVRQLKAYQDSVNRNNGYPGVKRIQRDLVGHSLAEGVDNGYRPTEWRWKIEEGQISDFKILKVLEKTKEQYLFEAKMRLSNGYYAYDAKVKIKYVFTSEKQWKLDYVVSQGMHIVVTHEYDEYVRAEIVSDGWGGTKCVQFTNRSELSLIIGGDVLPLMGGFVLLFMSHRTNLLWPEVCSGAAVYRTIVSISLQESIRKEYAFTGRHIIARQYVSYCPFYQQRRLRLYV